MKSLIRVLGIFVIALSLALPLQAQTPANDNFTNAITLVGPNLVVVGSNIGATKQFGGPNGGEPFFASSFGGASVWWNWTATAGGQTTIDTEGSDFDTILGVFTGGAINQLVLMGDNNDFNGNTWSRVQFNAIAGTTYRIVVDGFGPLVFPFRPATGNMILHVKGVGVVELSITNGMVTSLGDSVPVFVNLTSDFPSPPAARVDFFRRNSPFTNPRRFASVSN